MGLGQYLDLAPPSAFPVASGGACVFGGVRGAGGTRKIFGRMLKSPLFPRLFKKVQIQGGAPQAERGVLEVRRSKCRDAPTP